MPRQEYHDYLSKQFRVDGVAYLCNPVLNHADKNVVEILNNELEDDSEAKAIFKLSVDQLSRRAIEIVNLVFDTPVDYFTHLDETNRLPQGKKTYCKKNLISFFTKKRMWKLRDTKLAIEEIKKVVQFF